MNLYFRLVWIYLFSRFRRPIGILEPCLTPFRCWLTDLDVLRHMNNGKYFSLLDLARVDLMVRARVLSKISTAGFYPVVVAETMRFKKSIKLFQKFDVETVILGWDEKAFIIGHKFVSGQTLFAEAVVRARFLRKTGPSASTSEILEIAGVEHASPKLIPWVEEWNRSQK